MRLFSLRGQVAKERKSAATNVCESQTAFFVLSAPINSKCFLFQTPEKKQSESTRGRKRKPEIQSESSQGRCHRLDHAVFFQTVPIYNPVLSSLSSGKSIVRGPKISDYFDVSGVCRHTHTRCRRRCLALNVTQRRRLTFSSPFSSREEMVPVQSEVSRR